MLLAVLLVCAATAVSAADILYVGDVPLDAADTSIVNHLRGKNYTVKVVDDDVATLSDANNVTLVMISSSVDSAVLGATFRDASARVLVWDPAIQFDMAMTGPIEDTDWGIHLVGDRLHVMDVNHPLAATIRGNDEVVFDNVVTLGWGMPNDNADKVARERDGDHRILIYEYDKGAVLMNGQPAANKRIFFFMGDNGVDGLNANGLELFDSIFDFSYSGGDKESPLITHAPLDIYAEATSASGAIVTYEPAVVADNDDPSPLVVYSHASGVLYPIGTTTVTITATDFSGNTSTASFLIVVQDTTPPDLTIPADISVEADANGSSQIINYEPATATDAVTSNPLITYSQASGTLFPTGVTVVTVTATDDAGNATSKSFNVSILDTTPPTIGGPGIVNGNMTVEATGPDGAVVTFVGAVDSIDPNPTVVANPPSGSTFPLGVTTVNVTATDSSNNTATGSFTITVVDTTDPILTVPANIVIEGNTTGGALVNYDPATATDIVDQNLELTYSKNSGTLFPLGVTTVTVTATDDSGNSASDSFTVTVNDTTPPVIGGVGIINGNMTVEATGPDGAVVTFIGATDTVDPNPTVICNPPSGSTFPLGLTGVSVSATDASGNTTIGSFTITVVDTTPPVLANVPADMQLEATSPNGTPVTYAPATASDLVTLNPAITYSNPSGTAFQLGTTTVTVTATDNAGNQASDTFTVTVADTTPPTIGGGPIINGNLTAEATSPNGAVVNFVGATDNSDPNPTVIANPPSGSQFPLGVTTVNVTATDSSGNSTTGSFTVTVVDTTPPVISNVPADISIVADNSNGMSASWQPASATDLVSTPVIGYSKTSGSTFTLGETTVTITATDAAGNASTASFKVMVNPDVTPPIVISGPTANPNPALVGQVVNFSCAVSDTLPVLWNWNFGDGITSTTSGNVGHAYATAGTYPVTLEITDASGLKTTRQLSMVVQQPSSPAVPPIDTDGDGIPDYLDLDDDNDGWTDEEEIAAGTDPLDPNSFPKKPMVITKLTGSAKFNAKGKDGFGIAGFLPSMPAGFDPAGKTITLDLGGATAEFKLDAKGRAKNANGIFRVKMKLKRNKQTKKKEFLGGPVQFQARLKNGDWTPTWKDEGVDPKESKKKAALPITADMKLDKSVYTNKVDSVYNSKAAKGGVFKFTMRRKK